MKKRTPKNAPPCNPILTSDDVAAYHAVVRFIKKHGFAPTLTELAASLKPPASKQRAFQRIKKLISLGHIERGTGTWRNLVPVKEPLYSVKKK